MVSVEGNEVITIGPVRDKDLSEVADMTLKLQNFDATSEEIG
jgi:hypothetical protein